VNCHGHLVDGRTAEACKPTSTVRMQLTVRAVERLLLVFMRRGSPCTSALSLCSWSLVFTGGITGAELYGRSSTLWRTGAENPVQ
jgi:hypothetical protein